VPLLCASLLLQRRPNLAGVTRLGHLRARSALAAGCCWSRTGSTLCRLYGCRRRPNDGTPGRIDRLRSDEGLFGGNCSQAAFCSPAQPRPAPVMTPHVRLAWGLGFLSLSASRCSCTLSALSCGSCPRWVGPVGHPRWLAWPHHSAAHSSDADHRLFALFALSVCSLSLSLSLSLSFVMQLAHLTLITVGSASHVLSV